MTAYGQFANPILGEMALTHGVGTSALLGSSPAAAIALAMGLGGCASLILKAWRGQPRPAPVRAVRAGRRA